MLRSTLRIAFVIAMGFLASCSKEEPKPSSTSAAAPASASSSAARDGLDRKDPAAVAKAVLTAFKAKDLKAIAAISTEENQAMLSEIAAQGEKHPRYASIFYG